MYIHNSGSTVQGVVNEFLDCTSNLLLKSSDSKGLISNSLVDWTPLLFSTQSHVLLHSKGNYFI